MKCVLLIALCCAAAAAAQEDHSGFRVMRRIYAHCEKSEQMFRCLKEQAIKITERAMKMPSIPVVDGIELVRHEISAEGRSMNKYGRLSDEQMRSLSSDELDDALAEKIGRFFESHQVSFAMRSLIDGEGGVARMIEEGRGKMKKYIGPVLTALALKGGFVAMAFQAIAMIAGKALLIGKIALVLSAIIGLKKLVSSGEAHEKTTYEIVKHPQVSQSHTYSSSHYGGGGDFEASGAGGHYRRSLDDAAVHGRVYGAHVPRS